MAEDRTRTVCTVRMGMMSMSWARTEYWTDKLISNQDVGASHFDSP